MPRAGLTRAAVVDLAVQLVDATPRGLDELTLAAVAGRAGVAVPSLYKHVGSLRDLVAAVALVAVRELARRCGGVTMGRSGEAALRALADEVRAFAAEHPGLYAASQAPSAEETELAAAQADAVAVFAAVLRGFDLPESRTVDAVRAIRAGVHGFVELEARGGFALPDDLDHSFAVLVGMLVEGVRSLAVDSR